jgi:predicted ester cyclase
MKLSALLTSAALALASNAAFADGMASVEKFYTFFSEAPVVFPPDEFAALITDDWVSSGDYSGDTKNFETFLQSIGGTAQFIPDFTLTVEEIYEAGDTIVVRGRAVGTPAGPFMGVDGEGRSFEVMTVDIHKIENGKIARSYHVEDWAGAMRQLAGQ